MVLGARPIGTRTLGDSAPGDDELVGGDNGQTISLPYLGDQGAVYAVRNIFEPLGPTLPYLGDSGRVFGPRFFIDGVAVGADPENRLRIFHYANAAALAAGTRTELDTSWGRAWQHILSDTGSGAVNLQNTDTDLSVVDYGDYIQFQLDGAPVFLAVVEDLDRRAIDDNEERDQYTEVKGRGALAEWSHHCVQPPTAYDSPLYGDVRYFGWMSTELDDTAWPGAYNMFRQDRTDVATSKTGTPLGWPDPSGFWIWSTTSTDLTHDPGISYFRATFTVGAETECAIYLACDDAFDAYLDGVPVGGNGAVNGWKQTFRADVTVPSGTHTLAIKGENFDRLASTNTAGLLVAVYSLDNTGEDDTLLLRTGNGDWAVDHYPTSPPGFTVGQVIRLLLEEAQDDSVLSGWTLSFDDITDSDGNPWPVRQQISFPVGLDLLSALRQLAESHVDLTFDAARLTLNAWNIGTAGVPSGSATADLSTSLGSLRFEGRG